MIDTIKSLYASIMYQKQIGIIKKCKKENKEEKIEPVDKISETNTSKDFYKDGKGKYLNIQI